MGISSKKITAVTMTAIMVFGYAGTASAAETDIADVSTPTGYNLASYGNIVYLDDGDAVVGLYAQDLYDIADQLDTLKVKIAKQLEEVGQDVGDDPFTLSINDLGYGVEKSGSVTGGTPASADELSEGTAAWVDGELLYGTGSANAEAYEAGYEAGYNKETAPYYDTASNNPYEIEYEIHTHVDGNGNAVTDDTVYSDTDPGGCYVAAGHTHDAVGTCPTASVNRDGYDGKVTMYTCDPTNSVNVNTWVFGCGKDENTVEAITIYFN